MGVYAITGTRSLTPELERRVEQALAPLDPLADLVVTGACLGVDAYAARMATLRGLHVHTVLPGGVAAERDPEWRTYCRTFEQLGPSAETYRRRNERLVEMATILLAFPAHTEADGRSRRSGTWMTVRIARLAHKPVVLFRS